MTPDDIPALVRQLREWVDGESVTYASVLMQDAAAALTRLARERDEKDAEIARLAYDLKITGLSRDCLGRFYADRTDEVYALRAKVAELTGESR